MKKSNRRYCIGIDPGTNTGIAIWDRQEKKLTHLATVGILDAMEQILAFDFPEPLADVLVIYIENPHWRTWFGKTDREVLQGAGSVKRDYGIWSEFCKKHGIEMVDIHPKNVKDLSGDKGRLFFASLTGWTGRTSVHAREAAYMVFGR